MTWHHLTLIQQLETKQSHLFCQFRWQIVFDAEHMWESEELEMRLSTNQKYEKKRPFMKREKTFSVFKTRSLFPKVLFRADETMKFISLPRIFKRKFIADLGNVKWKVCPTCFKVNRKCEFERRMSKGLSEKTRWRENKLGLKKDWKTVTLSETVQNF